MGMFKEIRELSGRAQPPKEAPVPNTSTVSTEVFVKALGLDLGKIGATVLATAEESGARLQDALKKDGL
jgi:hypothetical protein